MTDCMGPFIDGAVSKSDNAETIDAINPSNGQRCVSIPAGCESDVSRAVGSARRAFEDGRWSDMPPSSRKQVLHQYADLIARDAGALDALDAEEMGKPVAEPFGSAAAAARLMRFCAEALDKITGDVYPSDKFSFVAQRRVPRGVVSAIVPWNFPTYVAVLKVGPALAAGNSLVLKPSELSSRSALHLAELAIEAGLPRGALNIVLGLGESVGRALALHADVDMVTFTGSTAVGKRMLQYAGQSNMKVVMVECGGKSPQIVFDDGVDLDAAAEVIARFLLTNQGQICSVGSRLLVQHSIATGVVERIVARFQKVVVGDATHPKTTFGPLASAQQCQRVMQYIETAADEGSRLVSGGRRLAVESGGYFVAPTVLLAPSQSVRIAQEEIFGPVLSVIEFSDEREAIRIANSTMYGLAAYVWTADLGTGMRMAKAMRSSVTINAAAPFGEGPGQAHSSEPSGQSGIGTEGGMNGIEAYQRRQTVWFNHG